MNEEYENDGFQLITDRITACMLKVLIFETNSKCLSDMTDQYIDFMYFVLGKVCSHI